MAIGLGDRLEIEYLEGVAHPKVSPKTRHAIVQSMLVEIVRKCAANRGFSGTEWRFRLAPGRGKRTVFVPDVAFISNERLQAIPRELRDEPPTAPEIAIEVFSPKGSPRYLAQKIGHYLDYGSVLVLHVDPTARTIVAHTHDGVTIFGTGQRFTQGAVPWLCFEVDAVFEPLDALDRL